MMRSAVSRRCQGAWRTRNAEELFFGLVGDEAEGELPERHEVW